MEQRLNERVALLKRFPRATKLERYQSRGILAFYNQVGNDSEISSILLNYLINNSDCKRIELATLDEAQNLNLELSELEPHVFVVIGQDERPSDRDLICDPWIAKVSGSIDNAIYLRSEWESKMQIFGGKENPVLMRVDPTVFKLTPIVSYIRP